MHDTVLEAFAANDAFQQAEATGRQHPNQIVTLKDRPDVGQPVQPAQTWPKANEPIQSPKCTTATPDQLLSPEARALLRLLTKDDLYEGHGGLHRPP